MMLPIFILLAFVSASIAALAPAILKTPKLAIDPAPFYHISSFRTIIMATSNTLARNNLSTPTTSSYPPQSPTHTTSTTTKPSFKPSYDLPKQSTTSTPTAASKSSINTTCNSPNHSHWGPSEILAIIIYTTLTICYSVAATIWLLPRLKKFWQGRKHARDHTDNDDISSVPVQDVGIQNGDVRLEDMSVTQDMADAIDVAPSYVGTRNDDVHLEDITGTQDVAEGTTVAPSYVGIRTSDVRLEEISVTQDVAETTTTVPPSPGNVASKTPTSTTGVLE